MGISAGQCTYAPRPQNMSGVPYFAPPSNHGLPPLLQVQPSQLPSQANPIPPQPIFGTQYDPTPKGPNTGYHSFPGTQVPSNGAMLSAPFIYPKTVRPLQHNLNNSLPNPTNSQHPQNASSYINLGMRSVNNQPTNVTLNNTGNGTAAINTLNYNISLPSSSDREQNKNMYLNISQTPAVDTPFFYITHRKVR